MTDISMCINEDCPLKESCYRYKAEPSDRQAYQSFEHDKEKGCEYFWEVEGSK